MPKNLLFKVLFLLLTVPFAINAQIIDAGVLEFVADSVGKVESPVPADEVVVKNFLRNTYSSTTVTYRWWRHTESIPQAWSTSLICDEVTCWAPTVNTNELTLEPGDSALLDVHFQNVGRSGEGTVELLVFDVADSAGTYIIAKYYGKAEAPNSIATIDKSKVEIFPNPATSFINVKGLESIQGSGAKVEIYSIIGVKISETPFVQNNIDVSRLQDGVYMIKVLNDKGQQAFTKTFIKK